MNKNDIQITIGIPVYNVERSLCSELDQDFAHSYNILVVDDCGTDACMDIVRCACQDLHTVSASPSSVTMATRGLAQPVTPSLTTLTARTSSSSTAMTG